MADAKRPSFSSFWRRGKEKLREKQLEFIGQPVSKQSSSCESRFKPFILNLPFILPESVSCVGCFARGNRK